MPTRMVFPTKSARPLWRVAAVIRWWRTTLSRVCHRHRCGGQDKRGCRLKDLHHRGARDRRRVSRGGCHLSRQVKASPATTLQWRLGGWTARTQASPPIGSAPGPRCDWVGILFVAHAGRVIRRMMMDGTLGDPSGAGVDAAAAFADWLRAGRVAEPRAVLV